MERASRTHATEILKDRATFMISLLKTGLVIGRGMPGGFSIHLNGVSDLKNSYRAPRGDWCGNDAVIASSEQ
jgi:hypothetical protein